MRRGEEFVASEEKGPGASKMAESFAPWSPKLNEVTKVTKCLMRVNFSLGFIYVVGFVCVCVCDDCWKGCAPRPD